ncbi:RagB/SusD family nutrient uptake outer membrane protein [Dyadobacter sp. CY323]|uniref:RagB/SusD family nutrient uptake outer membrane protein n=1 Tax=Dyadobacter sp. CY323 TaxID=2907302 RepID=UPI001F477F32|nr:RagB/SusD family nutrient uptake outer membrane protein [Dyadobacter sp. CY323]MCE6992467.1 RagB/SusD family nutrient uptake outer membrane protein [Dyadobacter sp. CY323]
MKRILFLITGLFCITGCSDLLNKQPLAELSVGSAYKTESDALKAITAAYNPLLNFPGYDGYSIYDIVTDNAEKGGEGPSDGSYFNEIANFTIPTSNTVALQVWRNCYLGVYRSNLVLENVPGIEMNPIVSARILGEAKFLRAYYYFILVTLFGDVPLITKSDIQTFDAERTSKDVVYALIEKELAEASEVLPLRSKLTADEKGRATKGAAQAYLGKVYLYKKDFAQAETWFKKVMDSNEYALEADYYRLFTIAGEFGTENIFEINHLYSPQYLAARNQGSIRQGSAGMYGWGFANPTQDFVDAFEPGDPRLWQTVYKQGDVMPDKKIADVGNSETGYMSKKAYLLAEDFPATGDPANSGKNELKLRYGMLLLWYAEAANENGNIQPALAALNQVRKRARQGVANVLPDVTAADKATLRAKIWQEERVEYGMENHRYFDLIRQGRAGTVLRAYAAKYNTAKGKNFIDGINELFPIPQTEIDLSQGKLTQNKGY